MSDELFALIVTLAVLVALFTWVPCLQLCHHCLRRLGRGKSHILGLVLLLPLVSLLSGCTLTNTAAPSPLAGVEISGSAFGGQQAISGAKVYLLAANPAGYGSNSLSLLTSASTGHAVDKIGAYVTTAATSGSFTVTGDYSCTKGFTLGATTASGGTTLSGSEQVYLYIFGGDAGAGTNGSIGLVAALGPCNAPYTTKLTVNEVTTVAAAYAFSGFSIDALHLSSSGTALALNGLSNAGLNASNLVSLSNGLPMASSAGITRPVATLNTLANILAACVDSNGSGTACNTLFQYTASSGATGIVANNTASAAINLAHNPWPTAAGMTALYGLVPGTGAPYPGSLSSQPNDFTLGFNYTGGGINAPSGIAIDNAGNAWVGNYNGNSVTELSSAGVGISPASGYPLGGTTYTAVPTNVAIDVSGHVWVTNLNNSLYELGSTGALISPSSGYFNGGIDMPVALAIDASGNVWTANYGNSSLSKFSNAGAAISPSSGYTGNAIPLNAPQCIAIDAVGNVWACNTGNNSIEKFNAAGNPFQTYNGGGVNFPFGIAFDTLGDVWVANGGAVDISKFANNGSPISSAAGYTGGGLYGPSGIAVDGAGNVWAANYGANSGGTSISELSSTGTAISPSTGYTGGGFDEPQYIAIDGSGDVWTANFDSNNNASSVTELIGAATPVVTPLVANLVAPYTTTAAKP